MKSNEAFPPRVFALAVVFVVTLLFLNSHSQAQIDCRSKAYRDVFQQLVHRIDGKGYLIYVKPIWYSLPLEQKEVFTGALAICESGGSARILDSRTGKLLARWGSNGYVNYEK